MQEVSEETTGDQDVNKPFNIRLIKRGIFLFIGISLATFTGIFIYTKSGETLQVWGQVKWYYLALGLVFVTNDLILGALRNHIFISEFRPGTSWWVSMKANLANIFMGAVTPSQSGGGPAQVYIFHKHGVKLSDNISNSFFNWISTLIYFPLAGLLAMFILQDRIPDGFVTYLTRFGFSVFTTFLVVVIVGLFSPQILGRLIGLLIYPIGKLKKSWSQKLAGVEEKIVHTMVGYQQKYIRLLKTKPQLMIYSFLLTVLLYFNKYTLAYIIVLAFDQQADFWTVIAIQAIIYLLLYFSPSPGGSGIAEISISALMANVLPASILASFTLLYRSFLVFIPALLGSWVVLRQVKDDTLQS